MPADLHVHSNLSDGTNSPEELVGLAKAAGLTAFALTDHDNVSGIERAKAEGLKLGIEVIPGIELTTEIPKREVHILGYFLDTENSHLQEALLKIQGDRKERIFKIAKKLNDIGIDVTAEEILKIAGNDAPGRPHVAKALVRAKAVSSIKEAFDRYIDFRGPAYVSHYKLSPAEAVKIIREAKGAPVFAHPSISKCDDIIPELVAAGLKGIECFYPGYRPDQTEHYKALAYKNGLVVTGGTDFHGEGSGRDVKLGDISVTDEMVKKLKEAVE